MPEAPKDAFLNDYAERNTTNVILSHMPLLFTPGNFVQNVHLSIFSKEGRKLASLYMRTWRFIYLFILLLQVLKELSPQVIFTAHEHKAMHISLDTATDQLSDVWILSPYESPLYQLRMDVGDIHEVQIPTCSYRMGMPHMGYGLAYIGIDLCPLSPLL